MNRATSFFVAVSLLGSGCVLFSPPLRAGVGGGGAAGGVVIRNSAEERRRHDAAGLAQLRVAFTPMPLRESAASRSADLSLGWSLDWASAGHGRHDLRHGPFVEGVWFARREAPVADQRWRFGPTALVELQLAADAGREHEGPHGFGAAGGVLFEYASTARGPFFLGAWRGEMALGLAARVGIRRVDGGTQGYGIVSVEVRLPGVAAVALLPNARPR